MTDMLTRAPAICRGMICPKHACAVAGAHPLLWLIPADVNAMKSFRRKRNDSGPVTKVHAE